jgi:DNA polymerase III subunit epsilon
MKNIKIERPLVFLDVESTGLNVKQDRIIEITMLKIFPDGKEEVKSKRINPEIPIPAESFAIHGISNDDVKDEPTIGEYAGEIIDFLNNCDIAGFGIIKYDLPLIENELKRIGVKLDKTSRNVIDSMVIFHRMEPRDLTSAYKKYCAKELDNAHQSNTDVKATAEVLDGQMGVYGNLKNDIHQLHLFCNPDEENFVDKEGKLVWRNNDIVINFGQHQGKLLSEIVKITPDYLNWILRSDFEDDLKSIVCDALGGKYPIKVVH